MDRFVQEKLFGVISLAQRFLHNACGVIHVMNAAQLKPELCIRDAFESMKMERGFPLNLPSVLQS